MYNKGNVQPQKHNTGLGGSDTGDSNTPGAFSAPHELPAPLLNTHSPQPLVPNPPMQDVPQSHERQGQTHQEASWVSEVEQLFSQTTQNPQQRAEQLAALKQRYQQTVLGIGQTGWEG